MVAVDVGFHHILEDVVHFVILALLRCAFAVSFSFHILNFLDCNLFLSDWEGRVESFFFSPLRMSVVSLCRLPTASVVFVSGASQG